MTYKVLIEIMKLAFYKMHGLGNDFMVIDTRGQIVSLDTLRIRAWADRRRGIGFDQLVLIENPQNPDADIFMRIRNRDGSMAETCGNALRCLARVFCEETGKDSCVIETAAGLSRAVKSGDLYTIDMGRPVFGKAEFEEGPLKNPLTVNVGNPHAVFFMQDVAGFDLEKWGPRIETHVCFPDKTNVEIAEVIDRQNIRMRVWERGTGITGACGTGAAAVMAAAVLKKLVDRTADIHLDGGILSFEWGEDQTLMMSGPASLAYKGEIDL